MHIFCAICVPKFSVSLHPQEAYKPLSHQLKEGKLDFQALLPDLLYANMPPSLFVPIPEAHLAGLKVLQEKGLFLRQYYSRLCLESAMGGLHSEENMGAKKMVREILLFQRKGKGG